VESRAVGNLYNMGKPLNGTKLSGRTSGEKSVSKGEQDGKPPDRKTEEKVDRQTGTQLN